MTKPPDSALPLLEAFPRFFEGNVRKLCQHGEWLCWARRGSRDAYWSQVPTIAWPYIRIVTAQLLCQQELRDERVEMRHPETNRRVFVIEPRLCTVEKWFDPIFAPASAGAANTARRARYFAAGTVASFVHDRYLPSLNGRIPTIDEMLNAVRAEYPGVTREFVRDLKGKYAPGKAGRPQKSGGK
jgi:hypothetical protein